MISSRKRLEEVQIIFRSAFSQPSAKRRPDNTDFAKEHGTFHTQGAIHFADLIASGTVVLVTSGAVLLFSYFLYLLPYSEQNTLNQFLLIIDQR